MLITKEKIILKTIKMNIQIKFTHDAWTGPNK